MGNSLIDRIEQYIHIINPESTSQRVTILSPHHYKVVFEQNALILAHVNDTAPELYDRALQTSSLMRSQLKSYRHEIQGRLATIKSIVGLGPTLERIIGIPMAITLFDLEDILKERK